MKPTLYQRIVNWFTELPIVSGIVKWSKTHSFPGFHKVPIWDVLVFLVNEIQRDDLFIRAQAISFSFFLSLFPSLIALFTLIPILNATIFQVFPQTAQLESVLEEGIESVMPGNAGAQLFDFIRDIIVSPRFALLSFGFLLALYFSSNGMVTLMRGFEKSYDQVFRQRTIIRKQLVAIGLIFVLFFLLLISVIFIVTGNQILDFIITSFNLQLFSSIGLYMVRWTVIILIFYIGIAFIYRYGAATYRRFSFFSPGTTVATALCIVISIGFSFYVDNFGAYNKFYGSIGALIVIMLWIQFNVLSLLIGFELNVSIAMNRDLKEKIPSDE